MLTGALAIYQPAAMMFWVFAGIAWLTTAETPDLREVIYAGALMGGCADGRVCPGKGVALYPLWPREHLRADSARHQPPAKSRMVFSSTSSRCS